MTPRLNASRRRGFSLIELLTVIGIFAALMGILLPAIEKAREHANNLYCAGNLRAIGTSLLVYASANRGDFPRTVYDPAAPLCAGTNPSALRPFAAGGPGPNDTTATLFLLLRTQGVDRTFYSPTVMSSGRRHRTWVLPAMIFTRINWGRTRARLNRQMM